MFRNVPGYSGMFRVPDFIDGRFFPRTTAKSTNIIYLHTTVWCLVVMIVSIGVCCKEIGPSLSLVLIKMAKIWQNLAVLYGAKCRVPTNFIQ